MPQISIYVDEKTLRKIENTALRQNVSISKWVAEQIRSKVEPVYPLNFEKLVGSIDDESFIRPIEQNFISDSQRLEL